MFNVIHKLPLAPFFIGNLAKSAMELRSEIDHNGTKLSFVSPNDLVKYRIDTFSTKEPDTLSWIDSMESSSVLWDIGANIGLYSCYAAKKNCKVFSFEPSIFNLELLARNIFINNLQKKIVIVPLPLSNELNINTLNMTTTIWGGALSSFGQDYGQDGKGLIKSFEFQTIGISMDQAIELLKLPKPDYLKIDVDGIEHLILKGGNTILNDVKGVLVELNDSFDIQTEYSTNILKNAGLKLQKKCNIGVSTMFNQIWAR